MTTARRVLKIATFALRGSPVLKISECCGNGKVFFVLIPADPNIAGWLSFLLFTQRWIASLGILPPPPTPSATSRTFTVPHKTFAQAVSGCLPDKGRCVASELGSVPSVTVENEGITERRAFLERCIVFRFLTSDRIDWSAFKQWAHRNWESQLDAIFHKLDDGLWLLHCDSSAQLEHILSSDRWCFNQILLQLDKWIPEAGRSGVLLTEDVVWVTIRGIPLHLRSQELFRQLGEICGHYLGFESGDTLSSIRIRLRLKGDIPTEIPINHGNLSFPVRVVPDSIPPARCYSLPVVSHSDLRSKNKGVLCCSTPSSATLCSSTTDPTNIASSSCSAVSVDRPSGHSQTPESFSLEASPVVTSPLAVSLSKVLEHSSLGLLTEPKSSILPSEDMGGCVLGQSQSDASFLPPRTSCRFVGLRLGVDGCLLLSSFSNSFRMDSVLISPSSLFCGSSPKIVLGRFYWNQDGPSLTPSSRISLIYPTKPITRLFNSSLTHISNHSLSFPDIVISPTQIPLLSPLSSPLPSQPFSTTSSSQSEDELLNSSVLELAELLDLKLDGDSSMGRSAAISTCKEVIKRRPSSNSRSRTDLEHRRLGVSPDTIISTSRRSRREGCVASSHPIDEF
ncbi:hypothetical protein LINPERHAP1_LOCUS24254 [Linum perenne]